MNKKDLMMSSLSGLENRPNTKLFVDVKYYDSLITENIEVLVYCIEDGFLKLVLPNGTVRYIAIPIIRGFDIRKEVE